MAKNKEFSIESNMAFSRAIKESAADSCEKINQAQQPVQEQKPLTVEPQAQQPEPDAQYSAMADAISDIVSNKNKKQVSKRTRTFMISEEADKTLTALSKEYNLSKSVIMEKAVMAMAATMKKK